MKKRITVVTDNPNVFDRWTVYFTDGTFLSLSFNCCSPQGFSQWGEYTPAEYSLSDNIEEETIIRFAELPYRVRRHVKRRIREASS